MRKAEEGVLAEDDIYGDEWNLRDRKRYATGKVNFDSDTAVSYRTSLDKCETQYISLSTGEGYAWDGIHVEYDYHTWYSKGVVDVEKCEFGGDWVRIFRKDWGDCSWKRNQTLDAYYGTQEAPWLISIDNWTREVHNAFHDSHSDLYVKSVQPIKRQFTIKMLKPKALTFEGMTSSEVLQQYQQVMLGTSLDTTLKLYTGGNFSISRLSSPEMARLVGIEAVGTNGRTYRMVTVDGTSGTATPATPTPVVQSWPVTVADTGENGTVRVSPTSAAAGTRVTVTPEPKEGYKAGTVAVSDKNGGAVAVTGGADGTYSFIMPSGSVTVRVSFVKAGGDAPAVTFVDVPEGEWYTDAVAWAVANGVTNGSDSTHFSPEEPCTRAQMVTFLWRASGMPEPGNTDMPFTDVKSGGYYEKAVLWALEKGITTGVDETHFAPDRTLTRAETVVFLYRFAGASAQARDIFDDVPAAKWYAAAVTWAVDSGVTNGTGRNRFSPDDFCTRAQIVTFLHRTIKGA